MTLTDAIAAAASSRHFVTDPTSESKLHNPIRRLRDQLPFILWDDSDEKEIPFDHPSAHVVYRPSDKNEHRVRHVQRSREWLTLPILDLTFRTTIHAPEPRHPELYAEPLERDAGHFLAGKISDHIALVLREAAAATGSVLTTTRERSLDCVHEFCDSFGSSATVLTHLNDVVTAKVRPTDAPPDVQPVEFGTVRRWLSAKEDELIILGGDPRDIGLVRLASAFTLAYLDGGSVAVRTMAQVGFMVWGDAPIQIIKIE